MKRNILHELIDTDNYGYIEINTKDKNKRYGFRDTRLNEEQKKLAKDNDYYFYELRSSDADDSIPCTIEKSVLVNFYGTIISCVPIEELEIDKSVIIKDYNLIEFEAINFLEQASFRKHFDNKR